MRSKGETSFSALQKLPDLRRTGVLFMLGSTCFLLLTTAAESIYPNFSFQTNSISDMAALGTRTTVVEEAAVFAMGACWVAGAYYLFRNTGRRGMMLLNIAPGTGFLLAGLFPENVSIAMHSIGALLGFPLGAVAVLLSYRLIATPLRYLSVALGSLSVVSIFVVFLGQRIVGPCGTCLGNTPGYVQSLNELILGLGGWESMIIYPFLIWLIAFGSYLLARPREGFA
jgi:hypothetical membrane protein